MAEDNMLAWETSVGAVEMRRKFDDDEDEFEDGFTFDDDEDEDDELEDDEMEDDLIMDDEEEDER
jgi:hypothetical protein